MDPEFWHTRWQENRIGFHLPDTNPLLVRYWPAMQVPPGARVLVPLCGKSLDLLWLLEQDLRVTGIEISRLAVEALFAENGLVPAIDRRGPFTRYRCGQLEILCGDFFALDRHYPGGIDAVYDRASLIALPPAMRRSYATQLAALLAPGTACLLITLDYDQRQMNGPPFAVSDAEVSALYRDTFGIERLVSEDVLDKNSRFRAAGLTRLRECGWRLQRR